MLKSDLEVLRQARPYLRSAVALAIYLRMGGDEAGVTEKDCYGRADEFVSRLEGDVKAAQDG